MSVKVGINQNVYISKVKMNDKQRLEITFTQKGGQENSQASIFEQLGATGGGQITKESNSLSLSIFELRVPDKEGMTHEEKISRILQDMADLRNKLTHILSVFLTMDKIVWNPYAKTGLDNTNFNELLASNEVLQIIYQNFAKDFIAMMEPFIPEERLLRLKLCRQSTEKHYASLPSSLFGYDHDKKSGFLEPMEIPEASSNLAFSAYELKKQLNVDGHIGQESADPNTSEAPSPGSPFATR